MASTEMGDRIDVATNTGDVHVEGINEDDFKGTMMKMNDDRVYWNIFGWAVPKNQVIFFAQLLAIFLLMITSIINLSLEKGESKVWITFLAGSFSSLLPAPVLKMEKLRNAS